MTEKIDLRDVIRAEVYAWAMDRTHELADQLAIGDVRDLVERLEKRLIEEFSLPNQETPPPSFGNI